MFTVNQKRKNKIYKLGKLDDGNPIQQITRFSDKRQKETKKHGIKPDSKIRLKNNDSRKNVRWLSTEVDMHDTQI